MQTIRNITITGNNLENDEEVEGTKGNKGKMKKNGNVVFISMAGSLLADTMS